MVEKAAVPRPKAEDIRPTLNLDSKRAARAKAKKKGPIVTFAGKRYELPPGLSIDAARAISEITTGSIDALDDLLRWAFGDERPRDDKGEITGRDPRFAALDLDDAKDLYEFLCEQYGIELGNSPASTDS
jgi:hypothetical protein